MCRDAESENISLHTFLLLIEPLESSPLFSFVINMYFLNTQLMYPPAVIYKGVR